MFKDRNLQAVWEKVRSGARVTRDEALELFRTEDLIGLGRIADHIKRAKTGDRVTYVVNRQINPTNLCVLSCRFCDFASKKSRPNAYAMSLDEVLSKCSPDLKEVHIVGGLNHEWPFEYYVDIVRVIHEKYPTIQIKAYTAVEIDFFARR
jgi:aminodeoxyfutalosine synthase